MYKKMKQTLAELVQTIELPPIESSGDVPSLRLRLEIFKLDSYYYPKLWRQELCQLVAFSSNGGDRFDAEMLVLEDSFNWQDVKASSIDEVQNEVLIRIIKQLGIE